jgi:hypothetical protein
VSNSSAQRATDKAEARHLAEIVLDYAKSTNLFIQRDRFGDANFEVDFLFANLDLLREILAKLEKK